MRTPLRVRADRLNAYFTSLDGDYATDASRADALGIQRSTYSRVIRGIINDPQSRFINAVVEFFADRTVPSGATEAERNQVRGSVFADLFEPAHGTDPEPAAVAS